MLLAGAAANYNAVRKWSVREWLEAVKILQEQQRAAEERAAKQKQGKR